MGPVRLDVLERASAAATRRRAPRQGRIRILLTTEGTYPYALGGVTSWCDVLIRGLTEFDWQVLPVIAAHGRPPLLELPPNAREIRPIELWSEGVPYGWPLSPHERRAAGELPARLVRTLLSWDGDIAELLEALMWCRAFPAGVRRSFRSRRAWSAFMVALREVLDERVEEAGTPPRVDLVEAALLYQSLYWVARTAAVPTPETDVLHVTAAGWASVPALVHKALHGTPMVLTEHGIYVREAYLSAVRSGASPGSRFIATRLARGLARAAYSQADVVSPVTDSNAVWEEGMGRDAATIHVIRNGLTQPDEPVPPPRTHTVVSVGRLDPLKDIHTMLRAAAETVRHLPDARFLHYGPVSDDQVAYARSCHALHAQLGLGERFRFMGATSDPQGVLRQADVVLMSSISEGMPMAVLEAMAQGRPVVCTGVGGVPDAVKGCGVITLPGDCQGLAMGVVTLLRSPDLAWSLGRRGHRRLARVFDLASCVSAYGELLRAAASGTAPEPELTDTERIAA
ncbi:MAG: polysaccharide biosynthesis protein PelF [Solirubrobacteraceae bacterium]|jgi:glycosyltransferase involved in cell wall biosynthesis|nr:polysaccharide biosynthesis protein PelF [Solirubrobacteraceae bacterium]